MCCKEDQAELLRDLCTHLGNMLCTETAKNFQTEWDFFCSEYADQKNWLDYMQDEYIRNKECWAQPWRKVYIHLILVPITHLSASMLIMKLTQIISLRAGMQTSRKITLAVAGQNRWIILSESLSKMLNPTSCVPMFAVASDSRATGCARQKMKPRNYQN